ncbi:MAG: acetoacetate--CoA ligase [Planctomycetes bacterium]|nr:acetoacetate--CoA ligase [Planctomycetota bacterium]
MRAQAAPLWEPDAARAAATQISAFRRAVALRRGIDLPGYAELHRWSVERPAEFWSDLWDACGVIGERGERVLVPDPSGLRRARWFPDAQLSWAENALAGDEARPAIVAWREDGLRREWSLGELRRDTGRWRAALRAHGVGRADHVVAWIPNVPEAVAAHLAASSLGAVFASASPDFGVEAVLDRFADLEPKVLVAADGYVWRGREVDCLERLAELRRGLPSLAAVVLVPGLCAAAPAGPWTPLAEFLDGAPNEPLAFERLPFEHPLCVLSSSGTTGKPKRIVHGQGAALLQHRKEHALQSDVRAGDRVFFYTTCGWMMWNWLVSALASRATIVLWDGAPANTPLALVDLAAREGLACFGASASWFDLVRRTGASPRATHDLTRLRTVWSTGSPLAPEAFDWIHAHLAPEAHLASISGGTDILSCFVGGDPAGPVWRGEIQRPGLGMDVDVFDADGRPLARGPGELVCRPPFPSMPLRFHADEGDARYRAAYFERFEGVWCHGDWAEWTEHGGLIVHGRSDATLNVRGVRIGTAEVYREVLAFPEVLEAAAVELRAGEREEIALFVRLAPGAVLDDALRERIRSRLRANQSPRHAPGLIEAVVDLPRTKSGKQSEIAVREALHGRPVPNVAALANPECLAAIAALKPRPGGTGGAEAQNSIS